ncbi:acyl-CoA N-acyltransferase [Sporodiniella umbellata]|nr:acyl-CoA N-acyltransferase [Sporodiniella umbellata]
MPSKTVKKYVVCDKQYIEWDIFVKENQWLERLDVPGKALDNAVVEYYTVDKKDKKLLYKAYVVTWLPEYKDAFRDLNVVWIIDLAGKIETMDYLQLDNPQETILDQGGEIYLVVTPEGEVVGTTAMFLKHGVCELAKMAVKDGHQGKGYSNYLMRAGIDWAKKNNCPCVEIYTNSKLKSAVNLYRKHDFQTVAAGPHPSYERVNLHLRWNNDQAKAIQK